MIGMGAISDRSGGQGAISDRSGGRVVVSSRASACENSLSSSSSSSRCVERRRDEA